MLEVAIPANEIEGAFEPAKNASFLNKYVELTEDGKTVVGFSELEAAEPGEYAQEMADFARKRDLDGLLNLLEQNSSNFTDADRITLSSAYYRFLIQVNFKLDDLAPIEEMIGVQMARHMLALAIDKFGKVEGSDTSDRIDALQDRQMDLALA